MGTTVEAADYVITSETFMDFWDPGKLRRMVGTKNEQRYLWPDYLEGKQNKVTLHTTCVDMTYDTHGSQEALALNRSKESNSGTSPFPVVLISRSTMQSKAHLAHYRSPNISALSDYRPCGTTSRSSITLSVSHSAAWYTSPVRMIANLGGP